MSSFGGCGSSPPLEGGGSSPLPSDMNYVCLLRSYCLVLVYKYKILQKIGKLPPYNFYNLPTFEKTTILYLVSCNFSSFYPKSTYKFPCVTMQYKFLFPLKIHSYIWHKNLGLIFEWYEKWKKAFHNFNPQPQQTGHQASLNV